MRIKQNSNFKYKKILILILIFLFTSLNLYNCVFNLNEINTSNLIYDVKYLYYKSSIKFELIFNSNYYKQNTKKLNNKIQNRDKLKNDSEINSFLNKNLYLLVYDKNKKFLFKYFIFENPFKISISEFNLLYNQKYYFKIVDQKGNIIYSEKVFYTYVIFDQVISYKKGYGVLDSFSNSKYAINGVQGEGLISGSIDVVSLGRSDFNIISNNFYLSKGYIILKVSDKTVINMNGYDFIVCENPFLLLINNEIEYYQRNIEPCIVQVSADGKNWATFNFNINETLNINPYPSYFNWFLDPRRYLNLNKDKFLLGGINPVFTNFYKDHTLSPFKDYKLNDKTILNGDKFDIDDLDPDFFLNNPETVYYIKKNGFKFIKLIDAGNFIKDGVPLEFDSGADIDGIIILNWKNNN